MPQRPDRREGRVRVAEWSELYSLVRSSDVVIVVLEARNPLGTFSRRLWSMLKRLEKRGVLVLNKVDLIPREVGSIWARCLEKEYGVPVLPVSATGRIGTLRLRRLLRREARELGREKTVCLVAGVPKTGKSSIINVLRGKHSAPTSLYPGSYGYTKSYTLYRVESRTYIIDTPGVAPDVPDPLERVVRLYPPERVPDPIGVAANIIARVARLKGEAIKSVYGVDSQDPHTILEHIARKRGWLERGSGEPLVEQAAITVIRDYLSGKLPFYVEPKQ